MKFSCTDKLRKIALSYVCIEKYYKVAYRIIDSGKLNPFDFPALIRMLKGKTARYWARHDDQSIYVWLMTYDMELLALYIETLEYEY